VFFHQLDCGNGAQGTHGGAIRTHMVATIKSVISSFYSLIGRKLNFHAHAQKKIDSYFRFNHTHVLALKKQKYKTGMWRLGTALHSMCRTNKRSLYISPLTTPTALKCSYCVLKHSIHTHLNKKTNNHHHHHSEIRVKLTLGITFVAIIIKIE
jgi:hypothetical protein